MSAKREVSDSQYQEAHDWLVEFQKGMRVHRQIVVGSRVRWIGDQWSPPIEGTVEQVLMPGDPGMSYDLPQANVRYADGSCNRIRLSMLEVLS